MKLLSVPIGISITILTVIVAASMSVRAQDSMFLEFDVSRAIQTLPNGRYHIMWSHTRAAKIAPLQGPGTVTRKLTRRLLSPSPVPGVPPPGFYEGDVTKIVRTAKTLATGVFNPIFVNCATGSSCWGNPNAFQTDLGKSTFIHLTDQYSNVAGSFSLGTIVNVSVNLNGVDDCGTSFFGGSNPCLSDGDIQTLVNFVASKIGAGYTHLYHVFLPKGVDECITDSLGDIFGCYAPDVGSLFTFCAYHSFGNQSAGHLLYSVEPFQAATVGGAPVCGVAPPFVNGFLSDSTDSTLAHEIFEAISDPDINAYQDLIDGPLFGFEIGDTCVGPPVFNSSGTFLGSLTPTLVLNGHNYKSQLMYSNHYHACAGSP